MPLVRLFGERLLPAARQAALPTLEALSSASAVALYFSAGWCPPCRGFTPLLKTVYSETLKAKGLRCVFVSSDRDEASFEEYFGGMPWLALPYAERERRAALSSHFGVQTIPMLALVDPTGRLLTTAARDAVVKDPQGSGFPWEAPAVHDLATGDPGKINVAPSVVLLCEGGDAAEKHLALEVLEEAAKTAPLPPDLNYEAVEPGTGSFSFPSGGYALFVATGGPLAAQVREFAKLPPAEDGCPPQLLLLDVQKGALHVGPSGQDVLKEEVVLELLANHSAGLLEGKKVS